MTLSKTMSNFMRKNLSLCFSKAKCLPPLHDHKDDDPRLISTPTSVLLNTQSSVDDPLSSPSSSFDDSHSDALPDLTTVYSSQRFFFSSPGLSNSIVESPSEDTATFGTGGVAVWKYSPDPLSDFRRSMQEMVEVRELKDVEEDWDYLHKLLHCYLKLNPNHTHRFIVGAFIDLIISLMLGTKLGN